MGFSEKFVWGAATSSYQIEGAPDEDGKGLQIWDVYCKEPGRIFGEHTGDVACDHYHLYQDDVAVMKAIGLKAYRFSISWARIMPDGFGRIEQKGIDFYSRLIDCLLENGIEPYVTLFHWDLPYEIYKRGGWMNPDSVDWFAEYAATVVDAFSDRVTHFMTFNEPQCFIGLGNLTGEHAPGLKCPLKDTFLMAHHVMMAHGKAVLAMRAAAKRPIAIGYAPTGTMCYPKTNSEADVEAARRALFESKTALERWAWNVSWWSDPVMLGKYPEDGLRLYERWLPDIRPEDLQLMHQPLDFYGQNIYNGICVESDGAGGWQYVKRHPGFPKTGIQWPVTPECLYWGPKFLYERYGRPIYITENGISCHDVVSVDGKVHDPNRIDFLGKYLYQLQKCAEDGTDIRGYFQWSLMDNFEWAKGYSERFGLVYVDYETQKRILKDSAKWYRQTIETNGSRLPY